MLFTKKRNYTPAPPLLQLRGTTFYLFLTCSFLLSFIPLSAQDTLRLTIGEAEKKFLQNNLLILAQQCQVQAEQALIIQSRTFANPVITANFNLYDPENDLFFHTGPTGQKDFMIEQVIQLGGKRFINIELAKLNKTIAEAELADLLRGLRYSLHQSFFSIHQQQKNIDKCNRQLQLLDTLILAYKKQAELGNVSMKDLIRLKSSYLKINNEKSEGTLRLNEEMTKLNILVRSRSYIITEVKEDYLNYLTKEPSVAEMEVMALKERPDLHASQLDQRYAEMRLKLEKRNVVPDAAFNLSTDQRGGAFRNQVNFGVSMQLPLLNQNRGNIQSAKFRLQGNSFLLEEMKTEVLAEVYSAQQNMSRSIEEYRISSGLYDQNFEKVLSSVNENFKRRNMSILEFLDFLESYNEAVKELERIKSQIAVNAAQINYVTASKIY